LKLNGVIYTNYYFLVEKIYGIFPQSKTPVCKMMLRCPGKLDSDDVILPGSGHKLRALGPEMKNPINISDPDVGEQHGNFTS
jgi:hypothetical protein